MIISINYFHIYINILLQILIFKQIKNIRINFVFRSFSLIDSTVPKYRFLSTRNRIYRYFDDSFF